MAFLVYKLTCSISGKSYVGITSRALDTRWFEHCQRARHGSRKFSRLYQATQKYGLDAFTREVIATADTEDEARSLECSFIRQLNTFADGYNANEGGHGWLIVPDEVRRKSSAAQKGRVIAADTRQRMSAAKFGKPECATNFGEHTKKGEGNPRAGWFAISCPDGVLRIGRGLRAFCRENKLQLYKLKSRGQSKGFYLLDRFTGAVAKTADALT